MKKGRKIKKTLDLIKDPNVRKRFKWITYYHKTNNARKTCRYFGMSPTTFYKWFKRYQNKKQR